VKKEEREEAQSGTHSWAESGGPARWWRRGVCKLSGTVATRATTRSSLAGAARTGSSMPPSCRRPPELTRLSLVPEKSRLPPRSLYQTSYARLRPRPPDAAHMPTSLPARSTVALQLKLLALSAGNAAASATSTPAAPASTIAAGSPASASFARCFPSTLPAAHSSHHLVARLSIAPAHLLPGC
jgi:hypothetical protein